MAEFYGHISELDLSAGENASGDQISYRRIGTGYTNPEDVELLPDGRLLLTDRAERLYRVDPANADQPQAELIVAGLVAPQQVVASANGSRAWLVEYTNFGALGKLIAVDLVQRTKTTVRADLDQAVGIAVSANESQAYVSEQVGGGRIRAVDLATGAATLVAQGLPSPFFLTWADAAQTQLLLPLRDRYNRLVRVDLAQVPARVRVVLTRLPFRPSSAAQLSANRLVVCSDQVVTEYRLGDDDFPSAVPRGLGGGGAIYDPKLSPHDPADTSVACDMEGLYRSRDGGRSWQLQDGHAARGSKRFSAAYDPSTAGRLLAAHPVAGLVELAAGANDWKPFNPPLVNYAITGVAFRSSGAPVVATTKGILELAAGAWPAAPALANLDVLRVVVARHPATNDELAFAATPKQLWQRNLTTGGAWTPLDLTGLPLNVVDGPALLDRDQFPDKYVVSFIRDLVVSWGGGLPLTILVTIAGQHDNTQLSSGGLFTGGVYRYRIEADGTVIQWQSAMGQPGQRLNDTPYQQGQPWAGFEIPRYERLASTTQHTFKPAPTPQSIYVSVFNTAFVPNMYKSIDTGDTWLPVYYGPQVGSYNLNGGWLDQQRATTALPAGQYAGLGWGFGNAASGLAAAPGGADHSVMTNFAVVHRTDNGGTGLASAPNTPVESLRDWRHRYTRRTLRQAGGTRWQTTGLDVTSIWQYLVHPQQRPLHFIAATDIGLCRSEDRGETWASVSHAAKAAGAAGIDAWRNFYEITSGPGGRMWAAVSEAHDLPATGGAETKRGAVLRSDDYGQTWYRVDAAPMTGDRPVTSLNWDGAALHAAVWGRGVYRSNDQGDSWTELTDPPGVPHPTPGGPRAYRLHRDAAGSLLCVVSGAGSGSGLYRFDPAQQQWHDLTGSLRQWYETTAPQALPGSFFPVDCAASPYDAQTLWLCTSSISAGKQGSVFKTVDGGVTWSQNLLTLARVGTSQKDYLQCFAPFFDPSDGTGASLYVTTRTHGTWRTSDVGATWNEVKAIPFLVTQRLTFDPESPGTAYITTFGGGVWKVDLAYLTAARRVTCTRRTPDSSRITSLGGTDSNGSAWQAGANEVINAVERGEEYYVEQPAGDRVRVIVAGGPGGPYLKTEADGDLPNNLSALPVCP